MATSKEFHDYILEHLQKIGAVSTRKMMGGYLVYFQDRLVGDICDNCFLLKPTKSVLELMPDAERAYPYEGSKTQMVVVEDVEQTQLLTKVLHKMYAELPEKKKKTK